VWDTTCTIPTGPLASCATRLTNPLSCTCRYKKNFKPPNKSEGFTEIKEINFVPHFDDPKKEEHFYHFT
jgi:hypothetical protein